MIEHDSGLAADDRYELGAPDEKALAACRDVALRASVYMDAGDVDAMLALFTPNLTFVRPSTWPDISICGAASFAQVLRARPANLVSRHVLTNVVAVSLSPEEVRVRSYFMHFCGVRAGLTETGALPIADALHSVGEYEDILVRSDDRWLIANRTGRFLFGGI